MKGDTRGADAVSAAFAAALLDRDPRAAAGYFSPLGHILSADGTEVSGHEHIVGVLRQLTSPEQQIEIRIGRILRAGPVALCTQFWKRSAPGSAGEGFSASSTARLVLALTEERWEIVIASPWE